MNGPSGFRMNPLLAGLKDAYPASEDVLQAIGLGLRERSVVARLWVSEGIPFAFRDCPALYEEARTWLAMGLELDPKEISIGGSGRLGYSLASKRWGKAYRQRSSDLDFFAVSEGLFEGLRRDFLRWSDDYDNGAVVPVSEREGRYWAANRREDAEIHRERVPRLVEGAESTFLSRFLQGQQPACGSQSEIA